MAISDESECRQQSLLFALLKEHMNEVSELVEAACEDASGMPLRQMVREAVRRFVDAKMKRPDIAMALYQIASDIGGPALVKKTVQRAQKALLSMLLSAPDLEVPPERLTVELMYAAMAGVTRSALEAKASPAVIAEMRDHLVVMCQSYMVAVTGGQALPG